MAMTNTFMPFTHEQFGQVRVIRDEETGEPWFVAKDVCACLGFRHTTDATKYLDDDEKGVTIHHTLGGNQRMTIVSEPGLYSGVLRSRKPEVRQFKRWITHEVIPSIRKHGGDLM